MHRSGVQTATNHFLPPITFGRIGGRGQSFNGRAGPAAAGRTPVTRVTFSRAGAASCPVRPVCALPELKFPACVTIK